jgi:hypothetical protein
MDVTWESETRAVADHPYCPQYEEFKKQGKIYCKSACIPYVGTIGEKIAPGVKMEVVRAADINQTCRKALVFNKTSNE